MKEVTVKTERRYVRQFAMWMGIYAVMHLPMVILMGYMQSFTPWGSASWIFVALPLIPMLLALRALVRDLATLDELQRRIHLEAFAFGLACVCMLTFSQGMLQAFADVKPVSAIFVLPLAIFFWFVGAALAGRRYQS
jgi:hypothetical protein